MTVMQARPALALSVLLAGCAAPVPPAVPMAPAPQLAVTTEAVPEPSEPELPAALPLSCELSRGEALFGDRWGAYAVARFVLPPGAPVTVSLRHGDGAGTLPLQARLDTAGQKMLFCPVRDAAPGDKIACASFYALPDDLADGIRRTFDLQEAVQGAVLSCRSQG